MTATKRRSLVAILLASVLVLSCIAFINNPTTEVNAANQYPFDIAGPLNRGELVLIATTNQFICANYTSSVIYGLSINYEAELRNWNTSLDIFTITGFILTGEGYQEIFDFLREELITYTYTVTSIPPHTVVYAYIETYRQTRVLRLHNIDHFMLGEVTYEAYIQVCRIAYEPASIEWKP